MEPIVLFGIQFTLSLVAYAFNAFWYVAPRLSRLPREVALVPLLWVHAFRIVGGTILAPGAVDAGVPIGLPGDGRRWRPGNRGPGAAGIDRPACEAQRCDRVGLAVRRRWDAGYRECDHSIDALQRVHLSAWRELGDRNHACASAAGEQPPDFHAIAPSHS